ncbi:MAG: flagellar hook-basal body complex protein [Arcobacteraceae bacterium]|jgi:flagellar hook protein FlgE|nr:flagellar hook-basal body complex protein [Arcobacteraceae bacterium]
MIGALWTGISGLASHQTAIDNESTNVANVNTVGYKASRITFADQMYQNGIGKGSKVLDAEKLYVQGNIKVTGNNYDLALKGDGFFVVSNTRSSGISENFYTRAGNFRMGDNGTLQDASGNEVQGWAIAKIDTASDVVSTNSNINYFTSDYVKLAANQIIQFDTSVKTYTAKMTDYTSTSTADSTTVFSGAGAKTQSSKISDIESLISNYSSALEQYAADTDATSSPSIAQISVIDFPNGSSSLLSNEGDQIYVYINGNKISQTYVDTTATKDYNGDSTIDDDDNVLASREATYKALADQISNITGLVAYTSESADPYDASTDTSDVLNGTIKIKSLIPGEQVTIGTVAEVSGSDTNIGTSETLTYAVKGTGEGAVQSALEALKNAVAGSQRDVYSDSVFSDDDGNSITLATDDVLEYQLTVSGVPITVSVTADATIDTEEEMLEELANQINTDSVMSKSVEAKIVNGYLVVESKESGEEFIGNLYFTDDDTATTYAKTKEPSYSVSSGAGAELLAMTTTVDQTASMSSLQLKLDLLGISDSAFGEFSVDSSGLITMEQDGATYAIGQVAIAMFNNQQGLEAVGDNLLQSTNNSGDAIYNVNNDKTASIEGGSLELSTADLSTSLVNLMVFQRAFEANSKSITTADELLNTLINLKR